MSASRKGSVAGSPPQSIDGAKRGSTCEGSIGAQGSGLASEGVKLREVGRVNSYPNCGAGRSSSAETTVPSSSAPVTRTTFSACSSIWSSTTEPSGGSSR